MMNFIANLDEGFEFDGSEIKTDADQCVIKSMRSHASKFTPQYGFVRGMKEFGKDGWKATMSELKDNLLGMDAVHMVISKEINKDLTIDALAYLICLKHNKTGNIKAQVVLTEGHNANILVKKNLAHKVCSCIQQCLQHVQILSKIERY